MDGYEVPEKINKFHLNNDIQNFQYDRPFHKGPRDKDNWWFRDPNEAKNDMINYMQIKQWGPEADRLDSTIANDVLW